MTTKQLEIQTSIILKSISTSNPVKKYLADIINWILDVIRLKNKKERLIQMQILNQLRVLNSNIKLLNENISRIRTREGSPNEDDTI